ncbi:MAG: creatininase family protein [Burkholderiales bacterium]
MVQRAQNLDGLRTGAFVASLAWPDVEKQLKEGAIAAVPIGAAAKEHGRHLPMASDFLQAEYLAQRLAEQAHVLIWPTLGYGYYPAFTDYPGSCTIDSEVFQRTVEDIAESIFRSGANRLLIINTGISTIAPLESFAALSKSKVTLDHVYRGAHYRQVERAICRQKCGGHGDEAETSIMLTIAPDQVRMEMASPWQKPQMGAGRFIRSDPSHPNYSPDGIHGDPTLASREKGEKLLEAMLEDLLALL